MWETISRADIASAKAQLRARREELIRRHGEELRAMEQDQGEIETLEKLISAFATKYTMASSQENSESDRDGGLDIENSEGVSFFITQTQKSKLRDLGISDDQIRNMKPKEAHQRLGLAN